MAGAVLQIGDRRARDHENAVASLGRIFGPIPRYLYETLDDDALAYEIQKRWTAKRLDMGIRIITDAQLLRYMDPEKVQDHWRNFWTGAPLKKLQHSDTLRVGTYNWPRAIVEGLTGLITGSGEQLAYSVDAIPWDKNDMVSSARCDMVDQFVERWQVANEYERVFSDEGANLYALGRNWKSVITRTEPGPLERLAKVTNHWPGSVASFYQSDQRTLECVIVATEMLPGEAAAMYPDKVDQIANAVRSPSSWMRSLGMQRPDLTWNLNSTVTVLTCWYRSMKGTTGKVDVLLNAPTATSQTAANAMLLEKKPDSGYPDIPLRCTPRFKTNDRPPDEAQGALYDIAPLATQYDEVVSAAHDMLTRAFYVRYKLTNAYGRPPALIPNTSIIALRAGQDLEHLQDVVNNVPVDTFATRLEELMLIFPGLSRYFIGQAPPSETSGDAIDAAINASIQRQVTTRTEVKVDERWMYLQAIGQATQFAHWNVNGKTVSLGVLAGDYKLELKWQSDNPRSAVKAKQLAMAARQAGIISLETAQKEFGVISSLDETRKVVAERQNVYLRPDIVALTEQALSARQNRQMQAAQLAAPQPTPGGAPQQQAGQANNASNTVASQGRPPQFQNDNSRVMPPAMAGDNTNP